MNQSEILKTLQDVGALTTESHIVYTSGRHGSAYVNKDALYPHTELTSRLCEEMARRFEGEPVEVVLAPAIGGVILSQWVAFHLTRLKGREVLAVYAERLTEGDGFVIKRGYDQLCTGKKVLVVEDVLTTGISVRGVVETARLLPCEIVGVAALCNRGGLGPKDLDDVPRLDSLVQIGLESWEAPDCPLCRKSVPVNTSLGKGREFLAQRR